MGRKQGCKGNGRKTRIQKKKTLPHDRRVVLFVCPDYFPRTEQRVIVRPVVVREG